VPIGVRLLEALRSGGRKLKLRYAACVPFLGVLLLIFHADGAMFVLLFIIQSQNDAVLILKMSTLQA